MHTESRISSLREQLDAIRNEIERHPTDRFSKLSTLFPERLKNPDIVVQDRFAQYLVEVKAGSRDQKPDAEFDRRRTMYDTIPYQGETPRYKNVTIGNVNINVENLNIENLHAENVNIQINISKVDVFINLFEDIKQLSVADRLRELQVVAQNEIRSKSVLPESARTMFNLSTCAQSSAQ